MAKEPDALSRIYGGQLLLFIVIVIRGNIIPKLELARFIKYP
jgi:hypothetical protein